jgi:hypothetical protein
MSAAFQLTAFAIFFVTVSRHKPVSVPSKRKTIETWMKLVIASTVLFLVTLLVNQIETVVLALTAAHPDIPHWLDQRYLFLAGWGFPVLAVWGFNARWLPIFLGLREPSARKLIAALGTLSAGLAAAAFGQFRIATLLLFAASVLAADGLNVFRRSQKPPKTLGVSRSLPLSLRGSYAWLLAAAALAIWAAFSDTHGGIWGHRATP